MISTIAIVVLSWIVALLILDKLIHAREFSELSKEYKHIECEHHYQCKYHVWLSAERDRNVLEIIALKETVASLKRTIEVIDNSLIYNKKEKLNI